jgi:hypothetical protein
MYIPFPQMPDHSRVWVYQANRSLSDYEVEQVSTYLKNEMDMWAAHGAPLNASFEIRFMQVFIIAVNEDVNQASGCSIDASTRWFKTLGGSLQLDFFDRQIAKIKGDQINLIPLTAIKEYIATGKLVAEDLVIPPLTSDLHQYRGHWLQKVSESWLKKYVVPTHI